MLSSAASLAYSLGGCEVWYGAHADDAAGRAYPDCTPEFVDAMRKAILEGTGGQLTLRAPLIMFNKGEVVKAGLPDKAHSNGVSSMLIRLFILSKYSCPFGELIITKFVPILELCFDV